MKKMLLVWLGIFLMITGICGAQQVVQLPEIYKPSRIAVDTDQLYVVQKTTVHIYSLPNYKYIGKFGKAGEGPQEFMHRVIVTPYNNQLMAESVGKLSYFTRDGKFIKEQKTRFGFMTKGLLPLPDGFVKGQMAEGRNEAHFAVQLYDLQLNMQKVLFKSKTISRSNGKMDMFRMLPQCDTYKNKIFLADINEFKIVVSDNTGKKLSVIDREYGRVKLEGAYLKRVVAQLKEAFGDNYDKMKSHFILPDYLPAIRWLKVRDDKLYVITWAEKNNKAEMFVLDLQGKILKKTAVPFFMKDMLTPSPCDLANNNLYQMLENEDGDWALHVTQIK